MEELKIWALRSKKGGVRTPFSHATGVKHENLVGVLNCGEAVGHHNACAALGEPLGGALNQCLTLRVN